MWSQLTGEGDVPPARSSHTTTACGDKVYVFGGEQQPRVPVDDDIFCLHLDTGSWKKCITSGPRPVKRIGHCAAAVGHKLYVFGGRTGINMGEGVLNDMFCFDTESLTWTEIQVSGDLPEARSFAAMTSLGTNLFLFGGCSADRHNDLHRFDTTQNTWFKLPTSNEITPRGGPGLAAVDREVYVIAGFTGVEVDDAYRFNLDTDTWEQLHIRPNIPPTSVFSLTAIGRKMLLFGGETTPSTEGHAGAGEFTNDLYILDIEHIEDGWTKVTTTGDGPSPRGWMQTACLDSANLGRMVLFGGLMESNARANDTFVLALQ